MFTGINNTCMFWAWLSHLAARRGLQWSLRRAQNIFMPKNINSKMKEDHRSYRHNFCSCKKKAWEKIQACTGFKPLTFATLVQHSTIERTLDLCNTGVAFFFFRLSFRNCKSCVYNCDDLLSYNSSPRSSHIRFSCIHNFNINSFAIIIPLRGIEKLKTSKNNKVVWITSCELLIDMNTLL